MQSVLPCRQGIKWYCEHPGCLVTEETRRCPYCPDGHRLSVYAWYWRWSAVPEAEAVRIKVARLRCTRVGRTVSLLPDFCLPRRIIGPAILARFLMALVTTRLSLGAALEVAWQVGASRTTAESLLRGFLARAPLIATFLATVGDRTPPPLFAALPNRAPLALLVRGLLSDAMSETEAFVQHARQFHVQHQLGLI